MIPTTRRALQMHLPGAAHCFECHLTFDGAMMTPGEGCPECAGMNWKPLKDIDLAPLNPQAKKFYVGAYVPKGEEHPILAPCFGDILIGPVARRDEYLYRVLMGACNCKPVWLYNQKPKEI